jgi:hypothetical protein
MFTLLVISGCVLVVTVSGLILYTMHSIHEVAEAIWEVENNPDFGGFNETNRKD